MTQRRERSPKKPSRHAINLFREGDMDRYDPRRHRVLAKDIILAWAVALAFLALLIMLPYPVWTNFTSSTDLGTQGAATETVPHDAVGLVR